MGLHTAPLLILATINLAGGPSYTRNTAFVRVRHACARLEAAGEVGQDGNAPQAAHDGGNRPDGALGNALTLQGEGRRGGEAGREREGPYSYMCRAGEERAEGRGGREEGREKESNARDGRGGRYV